MEETLTLFTGQDPDAVRKILLNAPYPSLLRACRVNRNLARICRELGDPFWREKIARDFGEGLEKFRPKVLSPKQQYQSLYRIYISFMRDGTKRSVMEDIFVDARLDALLVVMSLDLKVADAYNYEQVLEMIDYRSKGKYYSPERYVQFLDYYQCIFELYATPDSVDRSSPHVPSLEEIYSASFTYAMVGAEYVKPNGTVVFQHGREFAAFLFERGLVSKDEVIEFLRSETVDLVDSRNGGDLKQLRRSQDIIKFLLTLVDESSLPRGVRRNLYAYYDSL